MSYLAVNKQACMLLLNTGIFEVSNKQLSMMRFFLRHFPDF